MWLQVSRVGLIVTMRAKSIRGGGGGGCFRECIGRGVGRLCLFLGGSGV